VPLPVGVDNNGGDYKAQGVALLGGGQMKKLIIAVILILIFAALIYWQYIRFFNVSYNNVRSATEG
ncbi:MAG: hypothetical protein ACYDEQ_07680, partial [Desulfocucumaceae bacterium]